MQECKFTYAEQKAPDDSEVDRSLLIVGSQCSSCFVTEISGS